MIFSLCCVSILNAASYQVSEPGILAALAKNDTTATTMTVSGNIDARDLYFISESMKGLKELNISEAKINAYSSKTPIFGQEIQYNADELPGMCFFNKEYTTLVLPKNLSAILKGSVAGCKKLTAVAIPEKVVKIEDYAFYDCDKLETVTVPVSVRELGDYVFANCDALKSAALGTAVPAFAFHNCTALTDVTVPATAAEIGESAFRGCSALAQFTFPAALKNIAADAFKGTGLTSVDLGECTNLETVGEWAFADNTALASIKFPANIKTIGTGAFFSNSSVKEAVLPGKITAISDFLFTGCENLNNSEIILESVVAIGKYALSGLTANTALTIPANVEKIEDGALRDNTGLTEITVNTPAVPVLGEQVFAGINQPNVMLKVADSLVGEYKAAEQWKEFNIQNLSSVGEVLADAEVKAYFEGTKLKVEAGEVIAESLLFDVNGLQLTHSRGGNHTVAYETADFTNNFYILAVKLASGKRCAIKLYR